MCRLRRWAFIISGGIDMTDIEFMSEALELAKKGSPLSEKDTKELYRLLYKFLEQN